MGGRVRTEEAGVSGPTGWPWARGIKANRRPARTPGPRRRRHLGGSRPTSLRTSPRATRRCHTHTKRGIVHSVWEVMYLDEAVGERRGLPPQEMNAMDRAVDKLEPLDLGCHILTKATYGEQTIFENCARGPGEVRDELSTGE
jgi:hypothetical protein